MRVVVVITTPEDVRDVVPLVVRTYVVAQVSYRRVQGERVVLRSEFIASLAKFVVVCIRLACHCISVRIFSGELLQLDFDSSSVSKGSFTASARSLMSVGPDLGVIGTSPKISRTSGLGGSNRS